jgi:pimeloyl-ACP methyl ester carboxylesterase
MKRVFSRDGTAIAFERWGAGHPIILVDGALCSRALGPMPKLAPLLAQHFTVFTYDRRGRNESANREPYSVEREIEDLEALIHVAGGTASVLGMSSGAALALRAAAGGLRIGKLALFEPPFIVDAGGQRPPADHQARLAQLVSAERRGEAVRFFMTKIIGAPAIFVMLMRFTPAWSKLEDVAHTLPYDAAIMEDFSLPVSRAACVGAPTLVIGGAKSPASLRHAVDALADAMPHAQRRMLEGQSHNVSPKALAPVLVDFFAASDGGRRQPRTLQGYLPSTTS